MDEPAAGIIAVEDEASPKSAALPVVAMVKKSTCAVFAGDPFPP